MDNGKIVGINQYLDQLDAVDHSERNTFYERVEAVLKRHLTEKERDEAFKARLQAVENHDLGKQNDFDNQSAVFNAAYIIASFDCWADGVCDE